MILYRCTLGQRLERPCIVYVTGFGCTNQLWIGDYMLHALVFFSEISEKNSSKQLAVKGWLNQGCPAANRMRSLQET